MLFSFTFLDLSFFYSTKKPPLWRLSELLLAGGRGRCSNLLYAGLIKKEVAKNCHYIVNKKLYSFHG